MKPLGRWNGGFVSHNRATHMTKKTRIDVDSLGVPCPLRLTASGRLLPLPIAMFVYCRDGKFWMIYSLGRPYQARGQSPSQRFFLCAPKVLRESGFNGTEIIGL